MKTPAFLLFVMLCCSSCGKGLRGSLQGEWKLAAIENVCPDMDGEINLADDSGCVTIEFPYAGGIATTMFCEAIIFDGDRAYWKADEGMIPAERDFTYMVDETETLVELCTFVGCLTMEYIDEELRWSLPPPITIDGEEEKCSTTWVFRK